MEFRAKLILAIADTNEWSENDGIRELAQLALKAALELRKRLEDEKGK